MRAVPRGARRWMALVSAVSAAALVATGAPASADTDAAPAGEASIRPGVTMATGANQCTSNFVFAGGNDVYLGYAAHCASQAAGALAATAVDGCQADSLPLGTKVDIQGASEPGTLAYSSWLTMQRVDETRNNPCRFNDFALVELAEADEDEVNPSVLALGGPTGVDTAGTQQGDTVYSFQSSGLTGGLLPAGAKRGTSSGQTAGGWNHVVRTSTPGLPGASGAPFLDAQGRALGVLSTLNLAPGLGSNGVVDLQRALNYMQTHKGGLGDIRLVEGKQPFNPEAAGSSSLLGLLE